MGKNMLPLRKGLTLVLAIGTKIGSQKTTYILLLFRHVTLLQVGVNFKILYKLWYYV